MVGVNVALGELIGEVGDIRLVFEQWDEGRFDCLGLDLFPVDPGEPRVFLDCWDVLDAFLGVFGKELAE